MHVILKILKSKDHILNGKVFTFHKPARIIFGRAPDCHCRITADPFVSRHHFLLEVDPPTIRLHDLGSRNGTYVYTKKAKSQAIPGKPRRGNGVELHSGDRIRMGATVFEVFLSERIVCLLCDSVLDKPAIRAASTLGNRFICRACIAKKQQQVAEKKRKAAEPAEGSAPSVRCSYCGRIVSGKAAKRQKDTYICISCRSRGRI